MTSSRQRLPTFNFSKKSSYDWAKLLGQTTLKRHEWLAEVWTKLYFENQEDDFLRNLSTDDMLKTRWFEKYGVKEPKFN